MRKISLITAVLLLSAVWVVAQSSSSTTPQSTTPDTSSQSASPQSSTPSSTSPSTQSTTPDTSSQPQSSQETNPSTSTTDTSSQTTTTTSSNNTENIKGCLSGSAGNYTLTDSASGKTYTLAGDTSKLSDHVGHEIRVTGSPAEGSSASSGMGSTGSSSASGSASQTQPSSGASSGMGSSANATTFNVKKVKMISSSCTTSK
ncbi:MAG: hypothetical protein ACRD4F_10540 [Candidatus Angelobacter sp.]